MIQISPGDLVAVAADGRYFYALILHRVGLFGGNWTFVFHRSSQNILDAVDLLNGPKNGYHAIWLEIAERRDGRPSGLAPNVKQVDMKAWPAPLVRLFLGEMTLANLRSAAADKDATKNREQLCEANFYGAEFVQLQRQKDEVVRLYRAAASDCPKDFTEWMAANAALRSLGVKP